MFVDGSQSPSLKFDQVEYQTRFEPPKTTQTTDNQRRRRRFDLCGDDFCTRLGNQHGA